METSVDTLVYQLEDDDTNVRWNTLLKLRRIAAVETSHFPVRNTRRFLQCVRRRIVGELQPHVAIEALRLLGDVMVSLGDSVDQIMSSILPHLIPILPKKRKNYERDGDSDEESDTLYEEMFQVFRRFTNVTNDLQAVADLLVNIGLGSGRGSVREASLLVLMRLLDERFLKRSRTNRQDPTRSAIGRGDKTLIVALVQAIIPALEDANKQVVIAAEEALAKLESYWGSNFTTDVRKFLSGEDKRTLQKHQEPIADFLHACTASPPPASPLQSSRPTSATSSSSDLREELRSDATSTASRRSPSKVHPLDLTDDLLFGFLKAGIVRTLTTSTSNSNADWKMRAAAVEKLYASCKEVSADTLRGLTAEERAKRMAELENLFDILVHLTQDVDVHLVKRALQITQILFRKLSPPRQHDNETAQSDSDDDNETFGRRDNRSTSQTGAAFYMTKMLAPMIETAANFAGDDDEMEGFVYTLLGQVFESGCVSVNSIEQVLASTSLRHRRSQVREEAEKVWVVLLLIYNREGLLSANYAPNEYVVQTLGRLLSDTNARVRDLALEAAAVVAIVCRSNIYALLETFIDDEYVSERIDWAALRARLRRKQVPELRSNYTPRINPPATTRTSSNQSNRLASSVEQSLDGVSELRMLVANDEPKFFENRRPGNLTNESARLVNGTVKIGGSLSDRSYFDQAKADVNGGASCRTTSSEEGPTTVDIKEKLSALRKKMDQLHQPRTKRVRRPNSQEFTITQPGNTNTTDFKLPLLPRSQSSPEQSTHNPIDDVDAQVQSKDVILCQSPRDKRVHPSRVAVALPSSDAFTTSPRQPIQLSPQQLQSLQSDTRNYEDRPLKSKFIERQIELGEDAGSLSPSHPSSDERPIRPMATSDAPDQTCQSFMEQENPAEFDNNDIRSTKRNDGEHVMSLATRKRLEAKAKRDVQANTSNLTSVPATERVRARENDMSKAWKKPAKMQGNDTMDEAENKSRPSGKQEPRYLEPQEITPLKNPKLELSKVLPQLQSNDWETNFDALSTVRRLAMHHANMIDAAKVHAIVAEIMKQVPNLRSSVSKNALLALESMCAAFSRAVDSEVESIVPVLLKRCGDSNTFVCESATASLHAVALNCSSSRVLSALGSHLSSKAVPIRREVARGIHAFIMGQTDNIQVSKDLPLILQLVGRCLEDSHNDVRDVAKQSVLYLHYEQHMSGERIKRFLPASAQVKVDSVLRGRVAYAPPVFPTPSSVSDVVSLSASPPATKKREPSTVPPRARKITKQPSSRTSPPPSSTGTRSKMDVGELLRLETKLDSSNWKDRFDALNETTDFICDCASTLVESGQMLNLFDQLIKRLDDGNAKVTVLALECMDRIVPSVGGGMEQVLPNFVPVLTKNLANARTSLLAQSVMQQLCVHVDTRALCQQFAIQTRKATSRVIPMLLDTLTQLTAQNSDDKGSYVLTRHVLPLALELLKEAKSGVKEANARLLKQLRRTLGPAAVSNAASKLNSAQQDKLAAALR